MRAAQGAPLELDPVRRELDEYFEGRRRDFDLPLDLRGREALSRDILERLAKVPYGEVTTYKSLAVEAGNPRAARAVGTIMNRNPILGALPPRRRVERQPRRLRRRAGAEAAAPRPGGGNTKA